MAVYAATTTLDTPRPGRLGNSPMGVLSGTCNLTNYNDTLVQISSIVKAFLVGGKLRVVPNGISSNGYIMKWDSTGKAFRAYAAASGTFTVDSGTITSADPTLVVTSGTAGTHPVGVITVGGAHFVSDAGYTVTGSAGGLTAGAITDDRVLSAAAAALAEAADDINVGTFDWIAVGQLG